MKCRLKLVHQIGPNKTDMILLAEGDLPMTNVVFDWLLLPEGWEEI